MKKYVVHSFVLLALLSSCASRQQNNSAVYESTSSANAKAVAAAKEMQELKNLHADMTTAITPQNVKNMKMQWMVETQTPVSHMPIPDGNFVYFGDWGGNVYKVNRQNGSVVWQKSLEQPKEWPWHGFAGPGAVDENNYYVASVEGQAFAINKNSGDLVWKTKITEDPQAGSLAKIMSYGNMLFLGLQSVEEPLTKKKDGFKPDFQGKVMALDAQTGRMVWETRLVEPPNTGVPMWTSFALDPATKTLFFTTGNNYTGAATELSDAIIAVDASTGKMKWHKQVVSNDVWVKADQEGPDYDFSGGPQLFDANINGQMRPLVGAANKDGLFYAFDRNTGDVVWSTVIGYGGVAGGMHGEASVGTDRILTWSNNSYAPAMVPEKHNATIKALDIKTGRPLWVKNKAIAPAVAPGFLAGDVYFVGDLAGSLTAFNANNGDSLWSANTNSPITGWVWADEGSVYFPTGNPKMFAWANGKNGIWAYTVKPGM